jgi:hypothetical protein
MKERTNSGNEGGASGGGAPFTSCLRAMRMKLRHWPAVQGFAMVQTVKALGVTLTHNLSMSVHVNETLAACANTLFALRTLRAHGLPPPALHAIFQATALAKLTYTPPAWWGLTLATDRDRLEGFIRRAVKFGFCSDSTPTIAELCEVADDRLFRNILTNEDHILHALLPPKRIKIHPTRSRGAHGRELPAKQSTLDESDFLTRLLFKNIY